MWLKGMFLILFALMIDGLQAVLAWTFLTAGSALTIIPIIGMVGPPLGIGIGFAVDVAISMTMGAGLILAIFIVLGVFDFNYVAAVFITEAVPGLDMVPGWTFLVIRCILKKNAETKSGIVGLASSIASAATSPGGAASGLGAVAQGISNLKGATGEMAHASAPVRAMYDSEPMQDNARERVQLSSDVGREISAKPTTSLPSTNQLHAKIA